MNTQRWKIVLEYDGTPFQGWQRQAHGPSVQQAIEEAIEKFAQERVTVNAAGRTDTGVHALGQVASFDLQKNTKAHVVRDALNAHLRPLPIVVHRCEAVASDFHARFSALARAYEYHILNQAAPLALARQRALHVARPLDVAAMQQAAKYLVGKHDFTSFRASECQAPSPVKTIDAVRLTKHARHGFDGAEIIFAVRARSFLHHMVRNIIGSLLWVGAGTWGLDDFKMALAARDRRASGPTAPPDGLYLTGIAYNASESEALFRPEITAQAP